MLKKEDYLNIAPDNPGVIRVNHATTYCHGDSKSLRIERKDDGSVHAKCFRCGQWGVHNVRGKYTGIVDTSTKDKEIKIEYDIDKWPGKALWWVNQYGLTELELEFYEFGYSEEMRRVIIPIWWAEEKVGWQARKIYDEDTGPKYITSGKALPGFMLKGVHNSGEIVLVEDVISAIKVGRQTHTCALLSTNPTKNLMDYTKLFRTFKIWLDMDNPQVVRAALKLMKSLRIFGDTKLIVSPKDPKYYSDYDIRGWLYGS